MFSVFQPFIDDVKQKIKSRNVVMILILVNILVFFADKVLVKIGLWLFNAVHLHYDVISNFYLATNLKLLLYKPWGIITYQFFHDGFLHIFFNMLLLYWFGRIFEMFLSPKKILPLYLLGGIAGGVVYIIAYNIFPVFSNVENGLMLGASASVLAIVFATVAKAPNFKIRMMLFGEVKLKYIALVFVVLDLTRMVGENPGGHIAHLGGALFGFLFIVSLNKGFDMSKPLTGFFDWVSTLFKKPKNIFKRTRKKPKVAYTSPTYAKRDEITRSKVDQKSVDAILDKISRSGYDSLTKEEKEFLFKYSKK